MTLIHNPSAGAYRAQRDDLVRLLESEGHEVRYHSARDVDWPAAIAEPGDLVAVAGGDGTVARVAKHMGGAGRPLAPLPCGTANNIARALGMRDMPLEQVVRGWKDGRRVKLDLGVASGPWGRRAFVEGIGAGLFACALPHVDESRTIDNIDRPDARVAYALQLLREDLRRCPPVSIRATLDGRDLSGEYVMFEALTLPYVGPNLHLAPDSRPGDGWLSVVLVGRAQRDRLTEDLKSWQQERPRLAVLPTHRGRRLVMDWTGFPLHIDDEIWPGDAAAAPPSPAKIEVGLQGGVEMLVPR